MSPDGPHEGGARPSDEERVAKLLERLTTLFGKSKAIDILRRIQESNLRRVGSNSSINVIEPQDIEAELQRIWDSGLAGLGYGDFSKVDDYFNREYARHRLLLRVLAHYIGPDEYSSVTTSFELVAVIRDRMARMTKRNVVIAGLYRRLDRFRYGREIFNQVSTGRLEHRTYRAMRSLEISLGGGGRAEGPAKERITQIFYASVQFDPTELWVEATDDPVAILGEIRDRLIARPGATGPQASHLDVYAVGTATAIGEAAVRDFLEAYPEFVGERHPEGEVAGFIRLKRGP